jgi:hypothetical protein
MHMVDLLRLEQAGGKVLQRYRALVAACDVAQFGSPDHLALAQFMHDWAADPEAVKRAVEAGS